MKQTKIIQLIIFTMLLGITSVSCEEEDTVGASCITYEDCNPGQLCVDGFCQDSSGDTGSDTSADTGSDTGNSGYDSDSADTGNSVDDRDSADSGNSVDDADTADTGDTVDDSDTANTGDSGDDEDLIDTGDSATCGNSIVETGETCELSDTKNCTLISSGGYSGGVASCATDCLSWNITNCTCPAGSDKNGEGKCEVLCGNGTVDGDEACEPTDTAECTTFTEAGFESGTATCLADCTAWDKTTCECPENYIIDGDGNCIVNNECTLGTHNCDTNATCTDTPDSFTCACNDYFDGDGTACTLCNTDVQCKSDCTACSGDTPKCKTTGLTTACVECVTASDCTAPKICSTATNTCINCVVESWTFSATSAGRTGTIQSWTVPSSGVYKITAYGAQGGRAQGGLGAKMEGDFNLDQDIVIKILVGQRGTDYDGAGTHIGGGGGTFVVKDGATNATGIYVIAGGGGASNTTSSSYNNRHGSTATSGNAGKGDDDASGGVDGNGGHGDARGPGGGGFYTNGSNAGASDGGYAYLNGGNGGSGKGDGGFGGGGGPDGTGNFEYAGGGGGYSGGGGGGGLGNFCAGGGGSYNAGINQNNASGNRSGDGYVTISRVCK